MSLSCSGSSSINKDNTSLLCCEGKVISVCEEIGYSGDGKETYKGLDTEYPPPLESNLI